MRTDVAFRLPSWAQLDAPEDRWVVLCANAAYGPFEVRDEAEEWRMSHAEPGQVDPDVPLCRAALSAERHRILRLDPPLAPPHPDLLYIRN
jgi:hypothetical protein